MKSFSYRAAESLSLALNPFLLLPIVILIAVFLTDFSSHISQTRWIGVVLLCNLVLPLWWIHSLDAHGVVLDDTLANKQLHRKRLIALLPIAIILLVEIIVMLQTRIYQPLFAVFLSSLLVSIIGGAISYYWKVSAHSIGLATTITLLAFLLGYWVFSFAIVIPFLAWARLKLKRHTPLQLLIGTIIPPIFIVLIFNFFKLI